MPAWSAPTDASGWLANMQKALAHSSYRGVLVFMGRAVPVTYQLVVSQGTYARMTALTGPSREILRAPEVVIRLRPNGHMMVVRGMGGGASPLPFPPTSPVAHFDLTKTYRLQLGGTSRVAGHAAQVMRIVPRDRWRYGYRVWIGIKSGLPLRSELVTADGRVLQQAFFTQLQVIDAPAAMSAIGAKKVAMVKRVAAQDKSRAGACDHGKVAFEFKKLPPGFHVLKTVCERIPSSDIPVTHMLIGDGLATVSLFVTVRRKNAPALVGSTTIGAVHAVGRLEGSFSMTAMGDAPIATVTRIARSLILTSH